MRTYSCNTGDGSEFNADCKRDVLDAAFLSDNFSWPRDSTANEVAESLDLASATLHGPSGKPKGRYSRRRSTRSKGNC